MNENKEMPTSNEVSAETVADKKQADKLTNKDESSVDGTHDNFRSELVLGIVAPVGTDQRTFEELVTEELTKFRYEANIIRISGYLASPAGVKESGVRIDSSAEYNRYDSLMTAGNETRSKKGPDFLGKVGIAKIATQRSTDENSNRLPMFGKVHVLHSIKHRREIEILREVYGAGFFLVGLYSNRKERVSFLKRKGMSETEALKLIVRDYDDNQRFGQQTSKVFELSDVFISMKVDNHDQTREEIQKFLRLLFGYPFTTPSRDENAMFLAYAASLRSGSLARQIGAVVTNKDGEIIATGTNDVPQFGGGQYWAGDNDARDFQRGFDANTDIRNELLAELIDKVADAENFLPDDEKTKIKAYSVDEKLKLGKRIFKGTALFGLTEYMRDVHAEMEALLACTRIGVSAKDGTVYCTTFPCHNCAKHIVDAGIKRVVYIEAYPKSKANDLHSDSLNVDEKVSNKVSFEPFIGIGPRRYFDLFSLSLGIGSEKERKDDDGKIKHWIESSSLPRFKMKHISYLEREQRVANQVSKLLLEE